MNRNHKFYDLQKGIKVLEFYTMLCLVLKKFEEKCKGKKIKRKSK